jgi:hypothetical protein
MLIRGARTNNATIEVIIESSNFNNSLAGYLQCPNSGKVRGGHQASRQWQDTYLKDGRCRKSVRLDPFSLTDVSNRTFQRNGFGVRLEIR